MMARSTTRSNQRPDTLMQDRICQVDETSCNARPDHTFGSNSEVSALSHEGTYPTSAVLSDAGYFAKHVTLSLALRSSGDAGRGIGRVGAAAALVAGRQGADRRGNAGTGREGDGSRSPQRSRGQRSVHLASTGANGREGRSELCTVTDCRGWRPVRFEAAIRG